MLCAVFAKGSVQAVSAAVEVAAFLGASAKVARDVVK
jgi:hypothetical protein